MKKRKGACCLAAGALVAAGLVWLLPVRAEAAPCYEWETHYEYYCATPICHRSIPSYFKEVSMSRECVGENGLYTEVYTVEKIDLGCCPHL